MIKIIFKELLVLVGLILTASGVPILSAAVASYWIFFVFRSYYIQFAKDKERILGIKIVNIEYFLIALPYAIHFLHPDTNKYIFHLLFGIIYGVFV